MKTIKGDLILTKDTTFKESIKVEGNITGYFNLKVVGNIDCWNITCRNIDCWNIDCWNIDCRNIDCWNIDCWNITCRNIIYCETIKLKDKTKGKIKARSVVRGRFKLEFKEWESD